jgi:3-oxoacyl-(acyl-carrier-protein) synthase
LKPIYIIASESLSALGDHTADIWQTYQSKKVLFSKNEANDWVCCLNANQEKALEKLITTDLKKKKLDKTVLMALSLGQKLMAKAHWQNKKNVGINLGSSRGATHVFEQDFQYFLETGTSKIQTSPTTTLGNISSWLAQDLSLNGPEISHSITCSTGLHALLNSIAWLNSGMRKRFIIGASEAPLTTFTIEQMKALKVYSKLNTEKPCESMLFDKKSNSMILAEGAILMALQTNKPQKYLAKVVGIGYGIEPLDSATALSKQGLCLQKSMGMALKGIDKKSIDAIVMHAPGTIQGDQSEFEAIKAIFETDMPLLTSNKWQLGHTFGASGLFSLELALLMLQNQQFIDNPFYTNKKTVKALKRILVNSVGFGGNAVSVLVEV